MKTLEATKYKQRGFTIIELVIVILVIGILSAVALPRMIDLTTQARKSALLAIKGNFSTSVELLRSQWIAENKPDTITNMDNQAFYIGSTNAVGSVQNIGATNVLTANFNADPNCLDLWNKLLRNPPKVSADSTCLTSNTCKFYASLVTGVCNYQDRDGNLITYDRSTGEVGSNIDY